MATKTIKPLATEDVTVDAPHATDEELAALAAAPLPTNFMKALAASQETHSAATPAKVKPIKPKASPMSPVVVKPKAKPTTKAKPSTAKPKAAPKVKAVERVPAETFVAELTRLHLSNTQGAKALGLSSSSISEFVGHGRGRLMAKDRWTDAKAKFATYAKASLK